MTELKIKQLLWGLVFERSLITTGIPLESSNLNIKAVNVLSADVHSRRSGST
ncbi:hypothetical protein [Myxosarcina sp. GI1(2024)]